MATDLMPPPQDASRTTMGGVKIVALTNTDARFYPLIGPFLGRREVAADLGGRLWDDDGKTWWVAVDTKTRVLGFCAARPVGAWTVYGSAYVTPDHRRKGVYTRLVAARDAAVGTVPTRATCTPASLPTLLKAGFVIAGAKGSYTRVERQP